MKKILSILLISLVLVGCGGPKKIENNKLVIGVMPSVDALPIIYAKENGVFEKQGIDVEIHYYNNAKDRDSEIEAGLVDAIVDDVLGIMTKSKAGFNVKALSSTDTVFQMVMKEDVDKEKVSVGMMEVSITNYLSDQFLKDKTVEKVFINAIPQRLEMTMSGQVDMSVLPEPVASQGEKMGLKKEPIVLENNQSPNLLIFTEKAILEKKEAISAFYKSYNLAVEAVNKDPKSGQALLVSAFKLNPEIESLITLPTYRKATIMKETLYEDVKTWMNQELNTEINAKYSEVFDGQFVK